MTNDDFTARVYPAVVRHARRVLRGNADAVADTAVVAWDFYRCSDGRYSAGAYALWSVRRVLSGRRIFGLPGTIFRPARSAPVVLTGEDDDLRSAPTATPDRTAIGRETLALLILGASDRERELIDLAIDDFSRGRMKLARLMGADHRTVKAMQRALADRAG